MVGSSTIRLFTMANMACQDKISVKAGAGFSGCLPAVNEVKGWSVPLDKAGFHVSIKKNNPQ